MAVLERSRTDRAELFAPIDGTNSGVTPTEYDLLLEEGPFEGVPVELVDGLLVRRLPQSRLHGDTVSLVLAALIRAAPREFRILPATTTVFGERRLEPDVSVAEPKMPKGTLLYHASEIRLAVEVSVSSLLYDRGEKTHYYAEGGVPEYWIVNPVARQIEVYREPVDGVYAFVALVLPGELLDALCIPGVEFAADDMLPPADANYD